MLITSVNHQIWKKDFTGIAIPDPRAPKKLKIGNLFTKKFTLAAQNQFKEKEK